MKKSCLLLLCLIIFLIMTACSTPTIEKETVDLPTPKETPIPIVPKDPIQEKIDAMTMEEKVGQLLMVGFQSDTPLSDLENYLKTYHVGGFILFKRNYDSFQGLYDLTNQLKAMNGDQVPLFFAVDEEGGTVSRLPEGGTKFPDAALIGKLNDLSITKEMGRIMGRELSAAGIQMNFAPVLDVLSDPTSSLLKKRAFDSDPQKVADQGLALIHGLQYENVIAVPKHFPGHGATSVDSHGKLPTIQIDKETLFNRELIPFKTAIADDVPAMMIGHLAFPQIDPSGLPATQSQVMLQEILRETLGFQGLAITDEIEMYGYTNAHETLEESILASFQAGIDVFIVGHTLETQIQVYNTLLNAANSGVISKKRLNESLYRILTIKDQYSVSNANNLPFEEAQKQFGNEAHKAFLKDLINKINTVK